MKINHKFIPERPTCLLCGDAARPLHEAVLLALDSNSDIKTMDPVFRWKSSEYYVFCERRGSDLFGVDNTLFSNIQFTEYSSNTRHRIYSVFHTFVCKQYPKDSTEDKRQIQELADLILRFCKERMHIGEAFHERQLDQIDIGHELQKRQRSNIDIGYELQKRQRGNIDEYNYQDL